MAGPEVAISKSLRENSFLFLLVVASTFCQFMIALLQSGFMLK